MTNYKSQGFGLIGLLISIAIIALMVFGFMRNDGKKNQIQSGDEAIKKAQDAADAQRQYDLQLQYESSK